MSLQQLRDIKPSLLEFDEKKNDRRKQIIEALPLQVASNNQRKTHMIQEGQNLKDIAEMYNLTLAQLLKLNDEF